MTKVKNIDGFIEAKELPKCFDTRCLDDDQCCRVKGIVINKLYYTNQARKEIGELDITLDIEKTMILLDKYILTHNFPITGIHQLREIATALSKGDILK